MEGNNLADKSDMAGMGLTFGRLALRQNMWLGLALIGIMMLALAWQNSIVYTWGITWLLGIPEWADFPISLIMSRNQ